MQAKPIDHNIPANRLQADLFRVLSSSTEAFEVLIFKTEISSEGLLIDDSEFVGTLEHKESKLTYASPIKSKAIELPSDMQGELATAYGSLGDGELEESTIMFFSEPDVPEQSLILTNDLVGEKLVTQLFYVLDVLPMGKHGMAGMKHKLIPFRGDVLSLLDTNNDNEPQAEEFGDLSGLLAPE